MNVLIYIPSLDQSWGGVRQYSIALLRVLARDKTHRYFIYHNSSDAEVMGLLAEYDHLQLVQDTDVILSWPSQKIKRSKELANAVVRRLRGYNLFEVPNLIDRLVGEYEINIIHCPYQFIPDTSAAKCIVTLHDVQEIHFPDFFTAEERAYRATHFLNYLRKADRVIVSYAHVKNDLVKYFGVPDTRIDVVLLDMGKLWFEKFLGTSLPSLDKLSISEKYLLYPANTWKHKNHIRLLESIASLRDKEKVVINMVCSGHLTPHYEQNILPVIEQLGLQNQVKFLGAVEETYLYGLYKCATGVIVPTLYEAGSFPLVESILMKVPVICSNVTSLPETIVDARFIFNPFDIEDMSTKIKLLWNSSDFREQSVLNSGLVGSYIKDNNAKEKFLNVYAKSIEIKPIALD